MSWIIASRKSRLRSLLDKNRKGLRLMAEAHRAGGLCSTSEFKELDEELKKKNIQIPEELQKEVRDAELSFADVCERLKNAYEKLGRSI